MGEQKPNTISDGDNIILKTDKLSFSVKVEKTGHVSVWRHKLNLGNVIGHEFGYKYEIRKNNLVKLDEDNKQRPKDKSDELSNKDNRNILDDGKSQKLSRTDIETLKKDGLSGTEIVNNLVENSATFNEKTEYSQAKYLNKKKQKYDNCVTILRPTLRLVAEMYYQNSPLKILNLRIDTLSQMLAIGNILPGGRYLTFESCHGLLTAAIMQRLGAHGKVVQLHTGDLPSRNAIDIMNFSQQEMECLSGLPIKNIYDAVEESEEPLAKRTKYSDAEDDPRNIRRLKRQAEWRTSRQLLQENKFDGLFIASKYDPNDCLIQLSEFVSISRPVVVFCSYKEPLIQSYRTLKNSGNFINLKLTETWLRNYQILPERSHPEINMSGGGGFILSGIKVSNE